MSVAAERSTADRTRRRVRFLSGLLGAEVTLPPGDPPVLRVVRADRLIRTAVERSLIDELVADGLLRAAAAGSGGMRLEPTAAARILVEGGHSGAAVRSAEHRDLVRRSIDPEEPPLLVDAAESPLGRLARRRDRDGRAYLSPARLAAGERLRRDFTFAGLMPTMTSNWSIGRIGGRSKGGPEEANDRVLAARDRVRAALTAVGGDLAGLLLDVCCFLVGLEEVEAKHRWPARSAKVVLDIALGRLAEHYGLAERAVGPDDRHRIRKWGSLDHRPSIGSAP
jgi:hypothetical protein